MSAAVGIQSSTELPLVLLHAEIVRYFKERETEQSAKRNEWFERRKKAKNEELDELEQGLTRTLFLQVMNYLIA